MAYVRKRGNHLAIVHGSRDPETQKVDQQVLFTIHSRAEAQEVLGEGEDHMRHYLHQRLEERHPHIRFDWKRIDIGIRKNMDALPDLHNYREDRIRATFRDDLARFIRRMALTDPQLLHSSSQLVDEHRHELEFLQKLIDWNLSLPVREPNQWNKDNAFYWRATLQDDGRVPPDVEEMATGYYERGEYDMARAVFQILIDGFDDYAEGHNYLGLMALEEGDLEDAIAYFQDTIEVGRRLFPKRIAKSHWWTDLDTRPYMRGLMNLALTYNQVGRCEESLAVCDKLEKQCGDHMSAAAHRASAYLCLGAWEQARDAARYLHESNPEEDLIAALAAFELGAREEVRAWFAHAALNSPHTVAMVLGKRMPRPGHFLEVRDHNGGISTKRSINGFLKDQSASSRRFFSRLWKETEAARKELAEMTSRWHEDRGRKDRRAFERMTEMRTVGFAERWARGEVTPSA